MENSRQLQDEENVSADFSTENLPKPFPLVRYYLLAGVLLVVGAFAIINFSTQRIQSGTAINGLRQQAEVDAERLVFDISVAITSYVNPGDDLSVALATNKRQFDRDVINALSSQPIVRVDILSPGGELVYSTDRNAEAVISTAQTSSVLNGTRYSRYHDDYSFTLFNGQPSNIDAVVTANPINTEWSVESGPLAVFVAFRDVTDTVPTVTGGISPERIAILGGTMAGLFVLLSWIVIRGHRFATEARERLSAMLISERDIRGQLDVRNAELEEANQAKSQFLTMISHELKTPLTSIIAFSQSLKKNLSSSLKEREARQFDAMARNGNLLKMLIDELLDVSAASTGKLRLQFEQVTAERILTEATHIVQPMIESREQSLEISMDESLPEFTGDPGRLQQVISNLLSNASKYSPVGSEVNLSVSHADENICFTVADKGIGISESDQQRLFSTFFRSEEAMASGVPGTGLGLVIVRSIVEGHGGTIRIESEVGSGTTAYIELPVTAAQSELVDDESSRPNETDAAA